MVMKSADELKTATSLTSAKDITRVQELVYEMKVEQVMAHDVITVDPSLPMSELRALLRDKRISGVPVVKEDILEGVVSIEDFIRYLAEGQPNCSVSERMQRKVNTLFDNDSLVRAVEEFDRLGYGRFPVISRNSGKLVGIITKGDIIRGLLKKMEIDYHAEEIHRYRASHIFEDIIADKTTLIFQYKVFSRDFNRAGETSSGLKKTLRRMGISPQIIRRVAIATYEAEMNIVVFTEGGEITARVTPEEIRVEAVDDGPGIADIQKAMQPGYSTAQDWVRALGFGAGMGLTNIQKCSDEMHLVSRLGEGTKLEFIIHLNNVFINAAAHHN